MGPALAAFFLLGLLLPVGTVAQSVAPTFPIYVDQTAIDEETTNLLVAHLQTIDENLEKIDLSVRKEPLAEGEVGLDRLRYRDFRRGHKLEASLLTSLGTTPQTVKCHILDANNPGWCGAEDVILTLLNELLGRTLFNPYLELIPPLRILNCEPDKAGYILDLEVENPSVIDDTLPFVLVQDLGGGEYEPAGDQIEFFYWDHREASNSPVVQRVAFKQQVSIKVLVDYCFNPKQQSANNLMLIMWPQIPIERIDLQHGFTASTVSR